MLGLERERLGLELQKRLLDLRTRIVSIPGTRHRDDGEELFSEVCVACVEKLERYTPWTDGRIMQIAWNRWHSYQRKACRRPPHHTLEDASDCTLNCAPDERLICCETGAQLRRRLRRLRKEYRRVLWKRFMRHETLRQIATDMGHELETVSTWYKRAIKQLRRDRNFLEIISD